MYCRSNAEWACKCGMNICTAHISHHKKSCKGVKLTEITSASLEYYEVVKRLIEKIDECCNFVSVKTHEVIRRIKGQSKEKIKK